MAFKIRTASVFLATGMSLATLPALSAEPTEDMRASVVFSHWGGVGAHLRLRCQNPGCNTADIQAVWDSTQ